jgi:hypothetical protein
MPTIFGAGPIQSGAAGAASAILPTPNVWCGGMWRGELILSFVPAPEQRLWRTLSRTKRQLMRDRVHSQLESLLEDARLKLATSVSDLLGVSRRRMLLAMAKGETDPAILGGMAEDNLKATPQRLADALSAGTDPEHAPSSDSAAVFGAAGFD